MAQNQAPIFAPDLYAQQQQLTRQQKLAEMLQTQGLEMPQGQMIGNRYVAPAPTQHLARLASVLAGTYMNKKNDEKQLDLLNQQKELSAKDMGAFMTALQGTPEGTSTPLPADLAGPPNPGSAAAAPDPRAAMGIALQSGNPMLQAYGGKLFENMLPKAPKGININGQLVDEFTGRPMGERIAEAPKPYTLSPGETRLGADNKPVAEVKDFNQPFNPDGTPNAAYQQYKISTSKAGASNVNNTVSVAGPENAYNNKVGGALADAGVEAVGLAKQAPEVIRNAQSIRAALDKGAITGTGAEARLAVQKALETAGLIGEGKAASTQELIGGLGKLTLAGIKTSGLGAGNGFTDKDRAFLQEAISGTIDSTPANLRRVADLSERVAKANHEKGSKVLERWKNDPALKAVAQDSTIDALPQAGVVPFEDKGKEQRYQDWKKAQGKK